MPDIFAFTGGGDALEVGAVADAALADNGGGVADLGGGGATEGIVVRLGDFTGSSGDFVHEPGGVMGVREELVLPDAGMVTSMGRLS